MTRPEMAWLATALIISMSGQRPRKSILVGYRYDHATHALIRNLPWSSRSSQTPGIQKNADGSVDIYFGPKAPAGKESNWCHQCQRTV